MINKDDSLGIPNYGPWYIELLPGQDIIQEIINMNNFISSVIKSNRIPEFMGEEKRLQFINYGKTQLVFVITIDEKRQYTLLVNQPATKFGVGKKEFDNLNLLSENSKENVVKPLYYFADKNSGKELYITPYYYQSRCIGIDDKEWGMWIPEPEYHFKDFTDKERKVINSSMVAMLIKLYDSKRKLGLSQVRLDGGDFMIEKGFENQEMNYDNILKRIKLIAARELMPIELDEYIERIRKELSGQIDENEENIIVGKRIRSPLSKEEIEEGIQIGLKLKSKENEVCI